MARQALSTAPAAKRFKFISAVNEQVRAAPLSFLWTHRLLADCQIQSSSLAVLRIGACPFVIPSSSGSLLRGQQEHAVHASYLYIYVGGVP